MLIQENKTGSLATSNDQFICFAQMAYDKYEDKSNKASVLKARGGTYGGEVKC